jgi:hypothetical protein
VNTNSIGEGLNERQSKDITSKSKPMPLGVERGPKKKQKNLENHLKGKPDKPNNAFDAGPCHIRKIKLHNWNMECCKSRTPTPKGQ